MNTSKKLIYIALVFFVILAPLNSHATGVFPQEKSSLSQYDINSNLENISEEEYAANEILVKFKDEEIDPKSFLGKVAIGWISFRENIEKKQSFVSNSNLHLFKIEDDKSVKDKIAELENDPNVEYVEPNYKLHQLNLGTNDTYRNYLWGLDNTGQTIALSDEEGNPVNYTGTNDADIDMPEAWNVSEGADHNVIVAVIDDGVSYQHPDLMDNMWDGTDCKDESGNLLGNCIHGYDFIDEDKDPSPATDDIHGTHIAGTIGAKKNNGIGVVGVAPNVKIMALKFDLYVSSEIRAIDFATQNGAKVINASFGSDTFSPSEYSAVNRFRSAGGLFVAAAGNASQSHDDVPLFPCDLDLDNVICVASVDMDDELSSFSDFGASQVDVAAPGEHIISTSEVDSYAVGTGTSMAAPHVAGLAALMLGFKDIPYSQVKSVILSTGDSLASLSGKTASGKRINAYSALNYLVSLSVKAITAFTIPNQIGTATINESAHTIALTMPAGTNVTALVPAITITGASVSPNTGVAQDFTNSVNYTVTAADTSTQVYAVSVTVAPSSAKAITAFTIPNQIGTATINESAHTIALTMPAGTNVTALVPAITITGASVSPNTGVAQDFTNSVNYTVTAADASTQVYAVSVSVSLPSMDHLRATSIAPSFPAGSYSDFEIAAFDQLGNVMVDYTGDKSIIFSGANTAPDGTHPTCTDKDGVAINFGSPITITFTDGVGFCWIKLYNAESISVDLSDGAYSTTGNASYDYDVNVVPGNTNAGKTSISVSPTSGTVGTAESIVVMAKDVYGNSRTIGGDVVSISISGANIATPGATDNSDGTYTASYVPANFGTDSIVGTINVNTIGSDTDGTSDGIYHIAIASALSPSKAITAFTIPNQIGTATINESAHTIALTMPAGTNVTALVPAITITGASVSPNTGVAQDFTNSVNYTVTAADTSTQVYAVSVTVAPSSAKSITAFSFGNLAPPVIGTIDNDAGTVALTVSYGTDVTAMVPTVMHTGASVSPASGLAQDFTLPVTYTLTAQDNSTKAYVVTVNMSSAISAPISTIPDNEDYFKDLELSFDSKDVKNKKTSKKEVTLKFKNTDGIKYFKTSHNSHFEKADWEKMEKEINLDIDQQKRDAQKFFFKFKDKNDKTSKTYEKKVTFNPSPYSIFNFPKRGHKGDAMSQSGAGFSPNSRVALYFSGFWGGYYAPVYVDTDEKGSFSLNYKINKVFGWYRWYAVDLKTKTESKTTSYLVY